MSDSFLYSGDDAAMMSDRDSSLDRDPLTGQRDPLDRDRDPPALLHKRLQVRTLLF